MKVLTRHEAEPEPTPEAVRPDGFRPLSAHVRLEILGRIGRSMMYETPFALTSPDLAFTFRPDGRLALSDFEHPIDRSKTITLTVAAGWKLPRRQPGTHGEDLEAVSFVALVPPETVAQLEEWCVDGEGHTWRPGMSLPVRSPAESEWTPLSPAVITAIKRAHAEAGPAIRDSVGRAIGAGYLVAYDPTTGARRGTSLDLEIVEHENQYVMVSARAHPDDVNWSLLHVDPVSGRVLPSPVPLLPGVSL
jgi:hypothetical protein